MTTCTYEYMWQIFLMYDETALSKPQIQNNGTQDETDQQLKPILNREKRDERVRVRPEAGVTISNGTAQWTDQASDNTLSMVNLRVVPGKLTAIIGTVGSGKVSDNTLEKN